MKNFEKLEKRIDKAYAITFSVLAAICLAAVFFGYHHHIVTTAMYGIIAVAFWSELSTPKT